jgi:hypothetical protein
MPETVIAEGEGVARPNSGIIIFPGLKKVAGPPSPVTVSTNRELALNPPESVTVRVMVVTPV